MIIAVLIALGLCFGSFVNALVWRLHEQEEVRAGKKLKKLKRTDLSITRGRSMCVHCHHTLAWYDLLPVVSWLSLGGRCRYCQRKISWQYPLVELLTAGLFVSSYILWPTTWTQEQGVLFGYWLVVLVAFVALAVYDIRWMILPDRIVRPLQLVAVSYVLVRMLYEHGSSVSIATNALLAVLCSAGLFYALFYVSRGKWIGGGDVKLAVVLGLLLGEPSLALLMIFIASVFGSIVGVPLLFAGRKKMTSRLPFGPLLILATMVVYLFGSSIINWYSSQFLTI